MALLDAATVDDLVEVIRSLEGQGGYSDDPDGERAKLIRTWATAAAFGKGRVLEVLKGVTPAQADELLREWEVALGLPSDTARTDEERRARVIAAYGAAGANAERMAAFVALLQLSASATFLSNADTAVSNAEREVLLQTALRLSETDYDDLPTRYSLATVLERAMPLRNLGNMDRPPHARTIVTAAGALWGTAAADDGRDAHLGRVVLQNPTGIIAGTGRSPARRQSFGALSVLDHVGLHEAQRGLHHSWADAGVGFGSAGVGGLHRYHFGEVAGAGVTTVIDASDFRDRLVLIVGEVALSDITPGGPNEGANAGTKSWCFFYGQLGYTGLSGAFGSGAFQVDSTFGWLQYESDGGAADQWLNVMVFATPRVGERLTAASPTDTDRVATYDPGASLTDVAKADWTRVYDHHAFEAATQTVAKAGDEGPGGIRRAAVSINVTRPSSGSNQYVIDASDDWRDRFVSVAFLTWFPTRITWPGLDGRDRDYDTFAPVFFFSGEGEDPTAGVGNWTLVLATGIYLQADESTGALVLTIDSSAAEPAYTMGLVLSATEQIGEHGGSTQRKQPTSATTGDLVECVDLNLPQDVGLFEQGHQRRPTHGADPAYPRTDTMPFGLMLDGGQPVLPLAWLLDPNDGRVRRPKWERRQRVADALRFFTEASIAPGATAVLSPGLGEERHLDWRDRFVLVAAAISTTDLRPGAAGDAWGSGLTSRHVWYTGDGGQDAAPTGYGLELDTDVALWADPDDGRLRVTNETGMTRYVVLMLEGACRIGTRGRG